MLTQEQLKEVLDYCPKTGLFHWKVDRPPLKAGDLAGRRKDNRYVTISVGARFYRAHRLAWLWMTGAWPAAFLDHIDGNKRNNRWNNLRQATKSQNQANNGLIASNKSGLRGVSRYRQGEKWGKPWQAGIGKDGKKFHLGHFATAEEAHEAYCAAALRLFGEFARTG